MATGRITEEWDPGLPAGGGGGTAETWAATMRGARSDDGVVLAHPGPPARVGGKPFEREAREEAERAWLAPGAAKALGAGKRITPEEPDPYRTCFERDRDRVVHCPAFRRLAGKTQVFVFPDDHQRTRLTHALEVSQVATAVGRAVGLNVTLLEAQALAHDLGHTPGGHAGERAMEKFLPGFHHATWGAEVVLAPLNLCNETLDGVRCHSWSLPNPTTAEGQVLSWADRIAYCTHDLEDATRAGIVDPSDLPSGVSGVVGTTKRDQLHGFITAMIDCVERYGVVGMARDAGEALALLREFNYERIYTRPSSVRQGSAVVEVLSALVDFFAENPSRVPAHHRGEVGPLHAAVAYVAGMTDRFAFRSAVELLGWPLERLPRGVDSPTSYDSSVDG